MYPCALTKEQHQQPGAASQPAHNAVTNQQGRVTHIILQYVPAKQGVQQSQSANFTSQNASHYQAQMSNQQSPAGSIKPISLDQTPAGTSNNSNSLQTSKPNNANVALLTCNTGTTLRPHNQTVRGNTVYKGQTAQNLMHSLKIGQKWTFPSTCAPTVYQAGPQSFVNNSNAVHSPNGQSVAFSNASHKSQANSTSFVNNSNAAHSPNGQSVAFSNASHKSQANSTSFVNNSNAAHSPNGQSFAFSNASHKSQDNSTPFVNNSNAAHSPNGQSVAFSNASHKSQANSTPFVNNSNAAHSPNGQSVAFSNASHKSQANSTSFVNNSNAAHSPNGQSFAFSNASHKSQANSTSFVNNSNAAHSPNGQSFAFPSASHKSQEYPANPRSWCNYEGPAPSSRSHFPNQQYNSHNLQATCHYRSPTVPVHTGNVQEPPSYSAATQQHMINSSVRGPSSGMAPRSGSGGGLLPSYSGSHYTVTQERVSVPAPNSQPVSHAASKRNVLQAKQPHPQPSAQFSYATSNQFQKAPPQQSAGSTVPCSTVLQSLANAAVPVNHHKISTIDEEKVKRVYKFLHEHISHLISKRNSVQTKSSETPQAAESSLSNVVEQNDGSVGAPPVGLGNKAVAVVQPQPLECLQQLSYLTATSEGLIISEKAANSPQVAIIEKPPSSRPDIPHETKSSESTSSHAGGVVAGSPLSATDSGHPNATQKPEQGSQSEPAAQKPETPETQKNQNSPEAQGEKKTSCAASPGASIASSAKETLEGPTNLYFLKEDEVYTEPVYKSLWLNVNEQLDDIDKEFGFPISLKTHRCNTDSDEESQDAEMSLPAPVSETSDQASQQKQTTPEDRDERKDPSCQILSLRDSEEESFGFKLEVLSPGKAKSIFEQIKAESSVVVIEDEDEDDEESRDVYCITDFKPAELPMSKICPLKSPSGPIIVVDDDQLDPIIISDSDNEDVSNGRDETPEEMKNPDIIQLDPEEVCEASLQSSTLNCGDNLTENEERIETSDCKKDCEQDQLKSSESTEFPSKPEGVRASLNDAVQSEKRKRPSNDSSSQFTEKVKKCKQSDLRSQVCDSVSEPEKSRNAADAQSSPPKGTKVELVLFGSLNTSQSHSPGRRKSSHSMRMSEGTPPKILYVNRSTPKRKLKELEQTRKSPVKQCTESFLKTTTDQHKKTTHLSIENVKKHNKDMSPKVSELGLQNKCDPKRKPKEPEHKRKIPVKQWLHEQWKESFLPTITHRNKKMSSFSNKNLKKLDKKSPVSELGPEDKCGSSLTEIKLQFQERKKYRNDVVSAMKSADTKKDEAKKSQKNSLHPKLYVKFNFEDISKRRTDAKYSHLGSWSKIHEKPFVPRSILKKSSIFHEGPKKLKTEAAVSK